MTERVKRLRKASYETEVTFSSQRAQLITDFYKENLGKYSTPVMRALALKHICEHQAIYIGDEELIVGERGPFPKAVSTYPEVTCHSIGDLKILDSRKNTYYKVSKDALKIYEEHIIPYWRGRTMRERIFSTLPKEWKDAYSAGIFTEFMEQRAPGHTTLDGKFYKKGLLDFKKD
ncbi:MAG: formate C-acetyltransferase/glycerol dehydratase family glycyl radical enzyme, partial [Spirochaetota bacterium]